MIRITEPLRDPITMKVELELSQPRILDFLAKKGYRVEAYHLELESQEEMLISEPRISEWTFTATNIQLILGKAERLIFQCKII